MSANSAAAPDPTEIAGRYEVEKKLGAGAFGTVFKAKDRDLGRVVAIKTIRLEGLAASTASLEDLLKRFKQEAQVAARFRHPNVVMLYDIGTWEGMSYISMEFVDGVGLDRVIKGSGKMAMERAAAIGAQVADACAAAHKLGIVHRDIKPANIMIEPGDHVKVTDFGIAKDLGAAEHLTVTGSLLGTPSYMSPEQARGGAIDGRSDLFSVGCILYEMVSGQRAFRGESITALLFKIITEEPPSLRELDPTVSDEMLRIVGKALSKAPETRYQSGRELADDLLAITRPGYVPTLRSRDAPTLPPDAPPGDVPTLQELPTVRPEPTIASKATTPFVPPTILTPATAKSAPPPLPTVPPIPLVPRPQAPAAARAARPPAADSSRRKGGGAGMIVGLGIAGALLLALRRGRGLLPDAARRRADAGTDRRRDALAFGAAHRRARLDERVTVRNHAGRGRPSHAPSPRPRQPLSRPPVPRPRRPPAPAPARLVPGRRGPRAMRPHRRPAPQSRRPGPRPRRTTSLTSTTSRRTRETGAPRATRSRRSTARAEAARTRPAASASVPRCRAA